MSEAVGGMPPNSPETSVSSLSGPSRSPSPETFNSASDSDKRFLMPYYQLPDPDLDEFLAETDEILSSGDKRFSLPLSVPQNNQKNADLDNFMRKFSAKKSHQLEHTDLKWNEEARSSNSIEYSKAISCIQGMDDSKSPGVKRFALKELLKRKINEKKLAAFNKSKEISNLDENEEVESDKSENEESGKSENEQIETNLSSESDKETSDEDIEETVSFSFKPEKSNVEVDESDEDISIIKKNPRKLEISDDEDDDAELPDITTDFVHFEQNSIQDNVVNFEGENNSISSYQEFDGDSLPGIERPESPDTLASEICKSFETDYLTFEKSNLSSIGPSLPMDDPPILLTKNGSEIDNLFLSQDLAAVCSGSFNDKEDNKLTPLSYEEKHISNMCEESPFEEKMHDFFDLEAELSGEDDGEDDPDSDNEGANDLIASDHELPSNAELRDEIADLHLKHFIDDDEEILKEYKEKFLENGELHNDGRTRRFAWKNAVDMDDTKNDCTLSSSESEDDISDSSVNAEKAKWRKANEKEEITGYFNSSSKPLLKRQILGKPKIVNIEEGSSTRKRPRGSYLNLDTAAKVLKKLKKVPEECIINNINRQSVKEKAASGNPAGACNISNFESYFTKM